MWMNTVRKNEVIILLAEDDDGHADLIIDSLRETGIHNCFVRFKDGEEILDFFFGEEDGNPHYLHGQAYLVLLDIRMPKYDGVQVLERIKQTPNLRSIPIIMLTTTDDPREVDRCHELGCNSYITKPVDFPSFVDTLHNLGLFLLVIQVPPVNHHQ
jgi:CheY-like chemotaxis protein